MKIFLIRCGQTTGDVENRHGGDYDDKLTEKGKIQSKPYWGFAKKALNFK